MVSVVFEFWALIRRKISGVVSFPVLTHGIPTPATRILLDAPFVEPRSIGPGRRLEPVLLLHELLDLMEWLPVVPILRYDDLTVLFPRLRHDGQQVASLIENGMVADLTRLSFGLLGLNKPHGRGCRKNDVLFLLDEKTTILNWLSSSSSTWSMAAIHEVI